MTIYTSEDNWSRATANTNVLTNVAIDRPYIIPVTDVNTTTIPQELQTRLQEIQELINQQREYQYQQIIMNHCLENSKNKEQTVTYGITKKESKMTYKLVTCTCCGKKRRDYNFSQNVEGVCRDCVRRYYMRDAITREWIKVRKINGDIGENVGQIGGWTGSYALIKNLEENGYIYCERCQRWHKPNNIAETKDGEKMCLSCISRDHFKCEHCGKWELKQNRVGGMYGSQNICKRCADLYYARCPQCGRYELLDNFRNFDNQVLCRECYSIELQKCIHSYHDNRVVYTKRYTTEDIPENGLPIKPDTCFFGFELEVSGNKNLALEFLKTENIQSDVVLMSDSSIKNGGFEIVSMPMTKNYIEKVFIPKFTGALRFLRDNDFKGHNYGGLHIHISQDAVTNKQLSQLGEILYGNQRDRKIWLGITQRKALEMNSWSRMDNKIRDFYSIQETNETTKSPVGSPRYSALIKDDRTKTYEFRIFNSNLRIERFLKNYECVLALLDYTKENEQNTLPVCNTVGFIEYVYSHSDKYENLYNFFVERQIKEHYKNGYDEHEIERVA